MTIKFIWCYINRNCYILRNFFNFAGWTISVLSVNKRSFKKHSMNYYIQVKTFLYIFIIIALQKTIIFFYSYCIFSTYRLTNTMVNKDLIQVWPVDSAENACIVHVTWCYKLKYICYYRSIKCHSLKYLIII